ncbi:Type II secretion system (T2SS), protein F [uncultured archaeon]|nr:Type II secretion system (T2SS), protein F [uncultured archaeon]
MDVVKKYQKYWGELLSFSDFEIEPGRFASVLFFGSLLICLAAFTFFLFTGQLGNGLLYGIAAFALPHILAYTWFTIKINSRAAAVENALPDFLMLVASNMRAGLMADKALMLSARDEFGPLSVEVLRASKYSITGTSLDQVILSLGERIRSNTLQKTIHLVVEGMHSGGDMVELLEKTALDIRKFRSVRKEVSSMILNYVLFIVAAVTFGAPMLYGVATYLLDIMLLIRSKVEVGGSTAMTSLSGSTGIFKGQLLLTSDGVIFFAAAAIVVTTFFGCMTAGVMNSGRRMDGLKYFPILALIALALLFIIRFALSTLLGGMLTGA